MNDLTRSFTQKTTVVVHEVQQLKVIMKFNPWLSRLTNTRQGIHLPEGGRAGGVASEGSPREGVGVGVWVQGMDGLAHLASK